MKKIFFFVATFLLANFLVSKFSVWACKINFDPDPKSVGTTTAVTIDSWLEVGTPHYVKITRNGDTIGYYAFYPQVSGDKWQGNLFMAEGQTIVTGLQSSGETECLDSRAVTADKTGGLGGGTGTGISSPKSWLPGLNPGFGPSASQGIDFFKTKLIPFVISWAIFLVIFLSLVFLIIGGIMWITSGGNKEGLAKAKSTITYALVGLIGGAGSYVILRVIGQIF